jgi:HPt (histidine-containing phosphotransfer) domain-containing protein
MGYSNDIIALTANALIGREAMFLQNGFDGFISKPIDSRELNRILNEFIRNKKPPEVVEAARREQLERAEKNKEDTPQKTEKKSELETFFIQDAEKAIVVLKDSIAKANNLDDEEFKLYTTTVHGLKSVLAILEENELSSFALKLEKAGEQQNIAVISEETPAFLNELEALIAKFNSSEVNNDVKLTAEDAVYLRERLLEIKTACTAFNSNAANAVLNTLKQKEWPKHIVNFLDEIALHILHSAFRKITASIDNFTSRASPVRGQLLEW